MFRYRATLAYDGTAYTGFQRQRIGLSTIQGAVETAITTATGQPVTVIGAGRTDKGVHASGQVIAFDVIWKHSAEALMSAINAVLPDDIALQEIAVLGEVADAASGEWGFHPRYDARSRVYKYTVYAAQQRDPLLRRQVWHFRAVLDVAAMQQAADLLLGEHDFAALGQSPTGESTVRTVLRSEWSREGRLLVYRVEANAFLKHMVRRVVALLVAVGRRRLTVAEFEAILLSREIPGGIALAPPHGLVLEQVKYPGEVCTTPASDGLIGK